MSGRRCIEWCRRNAEASRLTTTLTLPCVNNFFKDFCINFLLINNSVSKFLLCLTLPSNQVLFKRAEAAQKLDVNPNIKLVIFQQFFCEGISCEKERE